MIEDGKVVRFHYILRDEQGDEIERSAEDTPMTYLHGANNIIPGLEAALSGKTEGDELDVTVTPEQGYGERDDSMHQRISAKYLRHAGNGTVKSVQATECTDVTAARAVPSASCESLAATNLDLQAVLNGQVVKAGPPSNVICDKTSSTAATISLKWNAFASEWGAYEVTGCTGVNPKLQLTAGTVYTFDQSDATNW